MNEEYSNIHHAYGLRSKRVEHSRKMFYDTQLAISALRPHSTRTLPLPPTQDRDVVVLRRNLTTGTYFSQ